MTASAKRKKEKKKDFQVRQYAVLAIEVPLIVYRNRS